jgi:hypothetical protein
MVKRFPPAQTRLAVNQAVDETFGRALIDGLRERGYSVIESPGKSRRSAGLLGDRGVPFGFRVSPVVGTGMYHLVLIVGEAELSRLYVMDVATSQVYAGGDWAFRE